MAWGLTDGMRLDMVNVKSPYYYVLCRTFEAFDDVIREARKKLSTNQDVLELSDQIKKLEPKNSFS